MNEISKGNRICFFARVDKQALDIVNFYKQDIDILNDIGCSVKIATRWSEIDWSCDIIYIWWWTWAFIPVFISKILKKKTIITGTFNFKCDRVNRDYFRRPYIERLLICYSVKKADRNIFVSQKELGLVQEYWNLSTCIYSPHIVDTDKYHPFLYNNRWNNVLLTIVWSQMSNMQRKCILEMIDAVEILLSKENDLKYYIAGRKGNGFEYIKNYIVSKKLENNIILLGEILESKKIELMQKCTIYMQVTKFEGFGLAIAEAMACGAPVITSDVGEVLNVVGDAGVICNHYSPEKIANEIELLLKDELKRKKISELARLRILENFQYSRRLKDIRKCLDSLF
jgi:glycosyltransferase involved in cell wall biosynthesis